MKLLLAIILIAAISLVGSRITFLNRKLPLGIRTILLTGVEYILIGVALGGSGLNILDTQTIDSLKPFLVFGLTWIGLLYGLQFEIKFLKKLPRFYFSITAIQALVTFLLVGLIVFVVSRFFLAYLLRQAIIVALVLGCAASCTAQSAIAIVNRNYKAENKGLMGLLRYISSVDGLFAVILFLIALSVGAGFVDGAFYLSKSILSLITSIGIGIVPALLMIALSRDKFNPSEYLVFLVGTVALAGGIAIQMNQSPLVLGLIMGAIIANFCRHRLRAIEIVARAERSIYIILLLLVGAYWRLTIELGLLLIGVYFLFRVLGKLAGAFLAIKMFTPQYHVPGSVGLGLLSEGGLAVAIVLDFYIGYPDLAKILMTIVIFSIILNELIGPRLLLAQIGPREIIKNANHATGAN